MTTQTYTTEQLVLPANDSDVRALGNLLAQAVESGAAVSFLAPLSVEQAEDWWREILSDSDSRAIFLVARSAEGIVGTVQLQPAWAPNQPHRGEIAKLLVQRDRRRLGIASQLMQAIEEEARRAGFRLLTLDAKQGEAAETLYRKMGWTTVGTVPEYAMDPDGTTPHDAVIMYKNI